MTDVERLVSLFICPHCCSPLQPAMDIWRCDGSLHPKQTKHTFDVARQGYVNLLPVQQKKTKAPGDSQSSIDARQRFLAAGHYQPLQMLICEQIAHRFGQGLRAVESLPPQQPVHWLDVGCGDGYYTQAMAQLGSEVIDNLIAIDISKPALATLAKRSKASNRLWYQHAAKNDRSATTVIYPIVASAAHLPLRMHGLTGISSIFSPILPEVFAEALQVGGCLIVAKPDIGHLATVREALFDTVRAHNSDKFLQTLAPYFQLLETRYVSTTLALSADALADLLTMTPYAYRAHGDKKQALLAHVKTAKFDTEAKFVVYVLQKKSV